ncbi:hypothetical protein CIK06_17125 [Plantactinospora sp. KBS50]|nr:hypothetical protein CIK06_17125 [Plantactinospora sp. KBS50]
MIVVGSANVDITTRVERLPVPGETVLGAEGAFRPGGKGANQAVAARRLGAEAVLCAAVGADAFGRQLTADLAAAGIDPEQLLVVSGDITGVAMIVVAGDGENTIVVVPGANHALDASAVTRLGDRLAPGDVLVLQLEVRLDTCLAAATAARRAGARVQLNAAPLPKSGDPTLAALLELVDVLVVNETEAASLSGRAAPTGTDRWIEVAADLRRLGPAACVVTLGARGAVAHDGDTGWSQPAFPASVVDTTGAGDAFCGALAYAQAAGLPLAEAVRRGCAAGALATARIGAQSALPTAAELDQLLAGEA